MAEKISKSAAPPLTQTAGRGAMWQISGGLWQTIIRLGASTILARVLRPSDFGLFGMALLFSEFITVMTNLGMGTGLIAKKNVTDNDLNTYFWCMAGLRLLMFTIAILSAPLAAIFFKEPRITAVIRVVAFTFIFSIPSAVSTTLLNKAIRFKTLVLVRGAAALIESGLAVYLVTTTNLAYWGLVIPMLVSSFFMEGTIFYISQWRPHFVWERQSFRYLFKFGINGLGFSITNYLHQNVDYLFVGRFLGPAYLGLYEFAYKIPHLVLDRISRPVGSVVLPALASLRGDDERLIVGFIKAVRYVTLVAYPMLGGLAMVAGNLVPVVWGAQWLPIVRPLQILCLCAALRCTFQPVASIFYCKERPDVPFKFSLVCTFITFIVVGICGQYYGLLGVSLGMLLSTFTYLYMLSVAFKFVGVSQFKFYIELVPSVSLAMIVLCCTYVAQVEFEYLLKSKLAILIATILSGSAIYIFCFLVFFKKTKKEVLETISVIIG